MESISESFAGKDELTKDADICLICNDGVRLSVHALFMSKWSRVLHDCLENSVDREIRVEESSSLWKEVLGIIYPVTPVTIIDWENVERVYQLGDKYSMPGLLQRCEGFLLSPENKLSVNFHQHEYVLRWLSFAARYHQNQLAEKCMSFIKAHYKTIDELRSPQEQKYLRGELAASPQGVGYIIDLLQFIMQQRR